MFMRELVLGYNSRLYKLVRNQCETEEARLKYSEMKYF